jgi:hypothetical protein
MATYYVTTSGNAANPGTLASPWTLAKAFLSAVAGDVVYIAPGTYVGTFTASNAGSAGNTISFIGDPTASISWGLSAGVVRITNITTDNALPTVGNLVVGTSTHYLSFTNLLFEGYSTNALIIFTTSTNISFTQCAFTSIRTVGSPEYAVRITGTAGVAIAASMNRCIGNNVRGILQLFAPTHSGAYNLSTTITNCLNVYGGVCWLDTNGGGTATNAGGVTIYNCTALYDDSFRCYSNQTTFPSYVYNSLLYATNVCLLASTTGALIENYNRTFGSRISVNTGANTVTAGRLGFEFGQSLLFGIPSAQIFSTYIGSPAVAGGTTSGAPLTDLYANLWSNTTPDNGSATYKPISGVGAYVPTERNAGTITIAPGSTSQSIEMYLGVVGLTASTSGLSARYNRTRTASVSIPLVARTIAQAWTSGGFAEVDATNMPGVYRLDIPDAALAAGADDVTIVVRGASGTNGAVMTVKLSSGGLTEAQTAAAVWDPAYTSYTAANSMGARVLKTTVDNRLVNVGTAQHIHSNVHAIVDVEAAASELLGALQHNGTDYISADLLTPVSAATSVHIGPYQLLSDGLGADQPLDVNVGTATSIDVQVTDANGTGIDITGATVSAKVYNSGGTLVATYAGTATYADNGRLSFGLTTTVTNTSGTYTVTVTRTTGATDTQIFGPLRLYVRPV